MEHIRFFAELGAVLLACIACPVLAMALRRGYQVPECFSCGAMKVRPSRATTAWDRFCATFMIETYRCSGCRDRFHAIPLLVGLRRSGNVRDRRVIRVAFRFRHGIPSRVAIRVYHLRAAANRKPGPVSGSPAMFQT